MRERERERGGRREKNAFLVFFNASLHDSPGTFLSPPPLKQQKKQADLTDPSSFDEALKGCTALIHTASPVIMNPEKGRERELLIEPAVQGAENALRAATRAKTVT